MLKNILLAAVPGLLPLHCRRYPAALLHLGLAVATLALIAAFTDAAATLLVTIALLASQVYRGVFFDYRVGVEALLATYPAESEAGEGAPAPRGYLPILRPRWWIPVLNWPWLELTFGMLFGLLLARETEVSFTSFLGGLATVTDFLHGLVNPEWALLPDAVRVYARQTLEIALLGTAVGFILALPLSLLCSRNLLASRPTLRLIYLLARSAMVVVRAVPTFLWGLIFVALVGLGPFPGVLAITVFSIGVMVKLFSEAIEAVDAGPLEAVRASGGNWVNMVAFGVFPQALPALVAQLLYCVEINVHSATVLGLIGAEGIGLPIHEYLSALAYESASVYILVTIVMTILIDYTSAYLRSRII